MTKLLPRNDGNNPLFIEVGYQQLELLEMNPDWESIPTSQAETYRLLLFLSSVGVRYISCLKIAEWFQLQSPAPVHSRIEHLIQKGLIRRFNRQVA